MLCIWELEHKRDWKWRIVKIRYALNIGNVWRRPGFRPSLEGAGINKHVWKGGGRSDENCDEDRSAVLEMHGRGGRLGFRHFESPLW